MLKPPGIPSVPLGLIDPDDSEIVVVVVFWISDGLSVTIQVVLSNKLPCVVLGITVVEVPFSFPIVTVSGLSSSLSLTGIGDSRWVKSKVFSLVVSTVRVFVASGLAIVVK